MLKKTNQYLIVAKFLNKKEHRTWALISNFLIQMQFTYLHIFSTSDNFAFLGIKYVFRKLMLPSLGNNNVAQDPSGWKIFFFLFLFSPLWEPPFLSAALVQ